MLLKKIITPSIKNVKLTRRQTLNRLQKAGGIYLGGGAFGDVVAFDKPSKINTVFKYFWISGPKDGYVTFLKTFIHDQHRLNNPYLPRIYSFKIFKEPNDDYSDVDSNEQKSQMFGRVEMERLVKIDRPELLDVDLLKSLYEQMFYDSIPGFHKYKKSQGKTNVLSAEMILSQIIMNIRQAIRLSDPNYLIKIKDPDLKNAIRYIKTAATRFGNYVDLHEGNIMWRITGTRPQLVIVDPLV